MLEKIWILSSYKSDDLGIEIIIPKEIYVSWRNGKTYTQKIHVSHKSTPDGNVVIAKCKCIPEISLNCLLFIFDIILHKY